MDIMEKLVNSYPALPVENQLIENLSRILLKADELYTSGLLMKIFSLIDLTTLNSTDTHAKVKSMCSKINEFRKLESYSAYPDVAAVCVYPSLIEVVKNNLKAFNVNVASVAGGFPASQTFIEIKCKEAKMAVEKGADEIDMVISIGKFLDGDYETVFEEIKAMKAACGKAHLKVILETGVMPSPNEIYKASILAMEAGADFIKTSTGKVQPAATQMAVYVMTMAIKDFFNKNGKRIGIKPAGGISDGKTAIEYYAIVKDNLGDEWLTSDLFRIGASSLANNLLSEIKSLDIGGKAEVKYF